MTDTQKYLINEMCRLAHEIVELDKQDKEGTEEWKLKVREHKRCIDKFDRISQT
jgi:hypothetical protein